MFATTRERFAVLSFLGIICWRQVAYSFTNNPEIQPFHWNRYKRTQSVPTSCRMVRNIDFVETLIFYGTNSIYCKSDSDESIFLPGVENLLEECKRDDTSVIAILDNPKDKGKQNNEPIIFRDATSPAPNPFDLWESIHSIEVQPKGFGGSSGFGRKAADPERSPMPARCVVLCDTEDKCRAARFAGMRVLCLTNNDLADAVMNFDANDGDTTDLEYYWESITMDDITTPGSFWLNPPLPKDDEGNRVDVNAIIRSYETSEESGEPQADQESTEDNTSDIHSPDDDDDEFLASVLMDMEPL